MLQVQGYLLYGLLGVFQSASHQQISSRAIHKDVTNHVRALGFIYLQI